MSEWSVRIVRIARIDNHPNADTLQITDVEGTPVIIKKGLWKTGDLAVYVPIDSVVLESEENLKMFGPKLRVKAKRLRGIFSRGVLYPLLPSMIAWEGLPVHEEMGIIKWESPRETAMSHGNQESAPKHFMFPSYTDIEGLRKWQGVFSSHPTAARDVVITEKIHGSNARFCHDGTRLWVGSRTTVKAENVKTWWWRVAVDMKLAEKFALFPMTVFYGEVFGRGIQDLNYGTDITFRIFDSLDGVTGQYNDWDHTCHMASQVGLDVVTELYRGPWCGFDALKHLAEGNSTICDAHVREGFVIKTTTETYDPLLGRVIMKLVGEGYDLR